MNENRRDQDEQSRIRALFEEVAARQDHVGPIKKIAIVSTQRSGSTYLGDMLSSTGFLPHFEEWFNRSFLRTFAQLQRAKEVDIERYSAWVLRKATNGYGHFTIKLHVNHIMEMESSGVDLLNLNFDFMIGLTRRDKLAQALSLAKARFTERWRYDSAGRLPDLSALDISNEVLFACLAEVSKWDNYFARRLSHRMNTSYLYEDIASDTTQVKNILRDLGIVMPKDFKCTSGLKKQSDDRDVMRLASVRQYLGQSR